jgi:2-oxo-3-hexenedioate decarboxylase
VDQHTIDEIAAVVDDAARAGQPIAMLTGEHPDLDLDNAYNVQRASVARRLERGEVLVGLKMGLTSRAKMVQMGVHNPIYGHLTDAMLVTDGGTITCSGRCHPRVEPEVAFRMATELRGPTSPEAALAAVSTVHPAIEVIDSRFKDFKFTLIDVIADNTSASAFVLGPGTPVHEVELGGLAIRLDVGDREHLEGSTAAILDHPANSLAELANMLAERGEIIPAEAIILAGAATAAVFVQPGDDVRVEVHELGSVRLGVVE